MLVFMLEKDGLHTEGTRKGTESQGEIAEREVR